MKSSKKRAKRRVKKSASRLVRLFHTWDQLSIADKAFYLAAVVAVLTMAVVTCGWITL